MSANLIEDIKTMHDRFGVRAWMQEQLDLNNKELLKRYLSFRLMMMHEELSETLSAAHTHCDAAEVVDGIIDLCVFAIGTLDIFGVDIEKAWNEVFFANMAKTPGCKPERDNKFGLPDLIKPENWEAPTHATNKGYLEDIIK